MERSPSAMSNPAGVRRRESRNPHRNDFERRQRNTSECFSATQGRFQRSHSSEPWRRTLSASASPSGSVYFSQNFPMTFDEFLLKVNCPFCLESQDDKIGLIKHLDEKCIPIKRRGMPLTTCQILATNTIKCNLCPSVILTSLEKFFVHVTEKHQKQLEACCFVYCSCCRVLVPSNQTQMEFHMKHEIHSVRRKSLMENYFLRSGIISTYGFFHGEKKFKCIICSPWNFTFQTPFAILHHFQTFQHTRNLKKNYLINTTHCCFCDKKIPEKDLVNHVTSKDHLSKENKITDERYELCLYCGFACAFLRELSIHMRSNCEEIDKIKQQIERNESTAAKATTTKKDNQPINFEQVQKDRSIIVKGDVDIVELLKTLKKFGKITYVAPYKDQKFIIEFQDEKAVELISLVSNFLLSKDNKLNIEFCQ